MNNLPDNLSQDPNVLVGTRKVLFLTNVNQCIRDHKYDNLRGALTFVFISKGKLSITMNSTVIKGKKHDMIVCPPNVILNHSEISQNFDAKVLILSNDFLLSIINNDRIKWSNVLNRPSHPLLHLSDDFVHLLSNYEKLLKTRIAMPKGRMFELVIEHLIYALLNDLACYAETCGLAEELVAIPVRQSDTLFKRMLTLVNESISSKQTPNRSIQYYADQLSVSPKYLTHVCKMCSGKTAKELIDSILINRIEYLLLRSDLSVKEIAMQLGFPDVSNFGRYVKSKLGSSPRAIRANAGK